jgi:hypothetical protein
MTDNDDDNNNDDNNDDIGAVDCRWVIGCDCWCDILRLKNDDVMYGM